MCGDSRNPVGIHIDERLAGILSLLCLQRTNEDTVGCEEVGNGGSFSQEFGVGEDVEAAAGLGIRLENGAHRLSRPAWHGRLLDDDLGGSRDGGDATRRRLDVAAQAVVESVRGDTRETGSVRD